MDNLFIYDEGLTLYFKKLLDKYPEIKEKVKKLKQERETKR